MNRDDDNLCNGQKVLKKQISVESANYLVQLCRSKFRVTCCPLYFKQFGAAPTVLGTNLCQTALSALLAKFFYKAKPIRALEALWVLPKTLLTKLPNKALSDTNKLLYPNDPNW